MAKVRRQAAEWAALIEQWRQSGLSFPAFCHRHGLRRGTMQNWVYKPAFRRAAEEARGRVRPAKFPRPDSHILSQPPSSFLPIRTAGAAPASPVSGMTGIKVVLGAGRRIRIGVGFDEETLRRVVAVLEGWPC